LAVLHNRSLRRVLLAFIGFSLAEWASWIAILVYAYSRGGATEAGLAALIQLAPSALVAPLAASMGDRIRRERALLLAYLVQAGTMTLTAAAMLLDAAAPTVYLAAAAAAASITLTRPLQAAILPSLSRTPAELTAANVASGALETSSILLGPILAGVALGLTAPGYVFVGSAVIVLAGAALVSGVRSVVPAEAAHAPDGTGWRGLAAEAFGGFGVLLTEERPRAILALLGAAAVLWGTLDILLVVLALDLLLIGEPGLGYLNAAIGAGGLLGALFSFMLIGRPHLAAPLALGTMLWALPLLLVGILPGTVAALVLLAAAGLGRLLMDVAGRTMLQRVAPERLLTRVFGVLEGVETAALAVGSILAPALIALAGQRGAFVAAGAMVMVVAGLLWRPLRRGDDVGIARPRELALLRGQPIFAPLGPAQLEHLAAHLVPVQVHAGDAIIRQGDPGHHFFIVVHGRVGVEVDGRAVREEGPGESFGEIALLRSVPRTATVRAVEDAKLVSLERRAFLEAITGQPASEAAAEAVVRERLGAVPDAVREEADANA
jgi:hypothetical protein